MFSGIVEETAQVVSLERGPQGFRLAVKSGLDHGATRAGDSIAIDGVCLTVTEKQRDVLTFDLSGETLRRSTLAAAAPGAPVNLERALVLGGRVHGHLVFGHVDTVVTLLSRHEEAGGSRLVFGLPEEWRRFVVPKGSAALAGVSLTVGEVEAAGFAVYLIPHTLQVTTLHGLRPGHQANLEVDMLARYVAGMLGLQGRDSGVTPEFLREHGYPTGEEELK